MSITNNKKILKRAKDGNINSAEELKKSTFATSATHTLVDFSNKLQSGEQMRGKYRAMQC